MKKMVMAVVPRDEAEQVLDALIDAGHTATFTESRGGMLRQSQLTLFSAVKEEELEKVLSIIRENCRIKVQVAPEESAGGPPLEPIPVAAELGGAVIFIWNLERFETH